MMTFFTQSQFVDVSRIDQDGWWIENTKEYVTKGTALSAELIEEQFTPSMANKIARYDRENQTWLAEIDDMKGKPYWDKEGNAYVIEQHDGQYPDEAILIEPPRYDANTQTVRYSDGQWTLHDILIGQSYYNSDGVELTVSDHYFELPENHSWQAKPEPQKGFDFVLNNGQWTKVADFRGKTVYHKISQQAEIIEALGEIDQAYTLLPPPSPYHTFDNEQWVLTTENATKQLNDQLNQSIERIDNKAAQVAQRWARFADEYKAREEAALAFQAAGFKGEVSVYISAFAKATGISDKEAAQQILQQANTLRQLQQQLAVTRMRKHELKRPKLSVEEMQTLTDDICAQIEQLEGQYD